MDWDTALGRVQDEVEALLQTKERVLVTVDGRAASGKSTFASALSEQLRCDVVHMDDFYIHPEQRTPERYAIPGGNADRERVLLDVIAPWQERGEFAYRPYDAHTDTWGPEISAGRGRVLILEGSYSGLPGLWEASSLHIFVTTEPNTQISRIARRNGSDKVSAFRNMWIPLEEAYFGAYETQDRSDIVIET